MKWLQEVELAFGALCALVVVTTFLPGAPYLPLLAENVMFWLALVLFAVACALSFNMNTTGLPETRRRLQVAFSPWERQLAAVIAIGSFAASFVTMLVAEPDANTDQRVILSIAATFSVAGAAFVAVKRIRD